MLRRIACLGLAVFAPLVLSGCLVTQGTYLKKVEEAEYLARESADLRGKQERLTAENNALKTDLAGQEEQRKALEQLLRTKSDALSQDVSELRQKIATLEDENRSLSRAREEKSRQLGSIYEKLLQDMKNEIAQGQLSISELRGTLTITIEASQLFGQGRAELKQEGQPLLLRLAEALKGIRDRAISVEGHTDGTVAAGSQNRAFPTGWELSAARAVSVARYLQRQGVDPSLMAAVARGDYRPVADGSTREGRSRNRRIDITLVASD